MREDQTVELAVDDGDCAVGIGISLGYHAVAEGTDRFRTPAPPGVGAAETGFVLEHYPERPFFGPLLADFRDDLWEFFSTPLDPQNVGLRVLFVRGKLSPAVTMKKIVEARAILRPSRLSSSCLISLTTKMPPLEAFSKKGARNATSSSKLMFSRRRPPRSRFLPAPFVRMNSDRR